MNIQLTNTNIQDCLYGKLQVLDDFRGSFTKVFQSSKVKKLFPDFNVAESYITTSRAGVLRGMHFQAPPDDHEKIVICTRGHIQDVVLDLRQGANLGRFESIELSERSNNVILIPKGVAHGFYAYEEAQLIYIVSTEHSPAKDKGIMWNSFGHKWPEDSPNISDRDSQHESYNSFRSPF